MNKQKLFENIENIFLANITRVSAYIIIWLISVKLLSIIYKFNFIELEYLLTIIWAIFAFWYWYKKYERDKELEIIEKYTEKYNFIKDKINDLINDWINKNIYLIEKEYKKLLNLFFVEYYLNCKWYISKELWIEWSWWVEIDIFKLIEYDSKFNIENIKKWKDCNFLIINIIEPFIWRSSNKNIKYQWLNYTKYIFNIILNNKKQLEYWLNYIINKNNINEVNEIKMNIKFTEILYDEWIKRIKISELYNNI